MSGFNVSIATAIKRFSNNIDFLQPLVEAVSNSLEAGAKNINIVIFVDRTKTLFNEDTNRISGYKIQDDGEGFTPRNRESFSTYMSEHKVQIGCKGVGRITWLKVFQKIKVDSYSGDEYVSFVFDENFSQDKFSVKKNSTSKRETTIQFYGVRSRFFEQGKHDLRANANLDEIRNYIEENLLIKLSLLKSESIYFNITISNDNGDSTPPICNASLRSLDKIEFAIRDSNSKEHKFYIYYTFLDNKKSKNKAYYCANGRVVEQISDKITFTCLPNNKSSIILVTSKFFDDHVNDERNKFDIPQSENNLYCDLSWEQINFTLQYEIENILIKEFPTLVQDNDKTISNLVDEFPHLAKYIKSDKSKIKNKDKILSASRRKYEQEKEAISQKFKRLLNTHNLNSEDFYNAIQEVTDMSARELAEYIVYRQQIITALQKLSETNDTKEHRLHNLFMKKGSESTKTTHNTYDNNLWLFDDKFMTYIYAASDVTIKKYKKALDDIDIYNMDYRPDLAVFFSGNEEAFRRDALIVEFKACGASLDQKSKSFWEINRNAQAIRESIDNINTIWCYTVTNFDEKFKRNIISLDFAPLFSNDEKNEIYYRFFKEINAHCYYISLEVLLADAKSRNNVFLDIIKKQ